MNRIDESVLDMINRLVVNKRKYLNCIKSLENFHYSKNTINLVLCEKMDIQDDLKRLLTDYFHKKVETIDEQLKSFDIVYKGGKTNEEN